MKKSTILFIMSSLGGGGAEKVLVDILDRFDYDKYEVKLFLLHKTGLHLHKLNANVDLVDGEFGIRYPKGIGRLAVWSGINALLLKRSARKHFGNKHFDVIISFMEGEPLKFHKYLINNAERNVTWVHIDLKNNHYSKSVFPRLMEEKRLYAKMDEVVFVSEEAKSKFSELFGLDCGRVIYNLIDGEKIREMANDKEESVQVPDVKRPVIINVGRLVEQKRQDRIIKVAAILKNKGYDIEFWILGCGNLEAKLEKMAIEYGVEDIVRFMGFKINPYPYVKAASIFMLTSDTEGMPLVTSEAMCLDKPVISTGITGPNEILEHGEYGILTGMEPEDIANRLSELLDTDGLLDSLSRKSHLRAEQLFSPDKTMQEIYAVIE